jgi:hypothetical protein
MSDPLAWPPEDRAPVPGPPQPTGSGWLLFCGIFFLLGTGILGYAVYRAVPSVRLGVGGAQADGRVIRNEHGIFPVVEFEVNGQQIVVSTNSGTEPPEFQEGDEVPVLYDRVHPEYAIIQSFDQMWSSPLILLAVGLFVATMSVLAARRKVGAALLLICLVPGGTILCLSVFSTISAMHLAIVGVAADGTVIRVHDGTYPIVGFQTADGQQVKFTGYSSDPLGVAVPVIYDPKHPRHASIGSFQEMWLKRLIGCAGGFVFTAIPLYIAWLNVRRKARESAA